MKKLSLLLLSFSFFAFQEVSFAQRSVYSANNSKTYSPSAVSHSQPDNHRSMDAGQTYKPVRSAHHQGHADAVKKETYHRPNKTRYKKVEMVERTPSQNPAVSQKQLMEFVSYKRSFSSDRCQMTIPLFEFLVMNEANQRAIMNDPDFYCIDRSDLLILENHLGQTLNWF